MIDLLDRIDLEDVYDIQLLETIERRRGNPRERVRKKDDKKLLQLKERIRGSPRERVRVDPFLQSSEDDFKNSYRFTKRFASRIVDMLKEHLSHDPRGSPVSPNTQVVCALHNWARHEGQAQTAEFLGLSQPSVSQICKRVAGSIAKMSNRFIQMPTTVITQEETMRKFSLISNFPRVIGAIGCTDIRMRKKDADGEFASVNVQMICDANMKIMDIVTRSRGSDEAPIFNESQLKQQFDASLLPSFLLGDNSYPCTTYLLTPVLRPTTVPEENFNASLINTRQVIDHCFWLWKHRFPCLSRGMFGDYKTAINIIVACAVLHNICIDMNEDNFLSEFNDFETQTPAVVEANLDTIHGIERRREFIEEYFR